MANFIQLVPPLFYQVGLWQAISDHGELMVETISNTKLNPHQDRFQQVLLVHGLLRLYHELSFYLFHPKNL